MGPDRKHYERAFEAFLRDRGMAYVMVDDARRALLEPRAKPGLLDGSGGARRIKSFDAVVYADRGEGPHLLVEVKGRRVDLRAGGSGRRECWTTMDDVESLGTWERLFGPGYEGVLVFFYWLEGPAVASGERGVFRFEGRAYAHRAVRLSAYRSEMKVRSPRWGTVDLPAEALERVGHRFGDLLEPGLFDGRREAGRGADGAGSPPTGRERAELSGGAAPLSIRA